MNRLFLLFFFLTIPILSVADEDVLAFDEKTEQNPFSSQDEEEKEKEPEQQQVHQEEIRHKDPLDPFCPDSTYPSCPYNTFENFHAMNERERKIHVNLGYLLEKVTFNALDFASYVDSANNTLPQVGKILRPKFNVDNGFTFDLGYVLSHDRWKLTAGIDYLLARSKGTFYTPNDSQIIPSGLWNDIFLNGVDFTYADSCVNHARVNYIDVDVEFDRRVVISRHFSLSPAFGIKNTGLYFTNTTIYTGGSIPTYGIVTRNSTANLWGTGPLLGLDAKIWFGYGISLFGEYRGSLLVGRQNIQDRVSYSYNIEEDYTSFLDGPWSMSPAVTSTTGIMYEVDFPESEQVMAFCFSYDASFYYNQFNRINVASNSTVASVGVMQNGTFAMIGLRASFLWSF